MHIFRNFTFDHDDLVSGKSFESINFKMRKIKNEEFLGI